MLPANSEDSQLSTLEKLCEERIGRSFESPTAFHSFSVESFREFWSLFLEWSDPLRSGEPEPVCTDDRCEMATFLPNLRLNYVENLLDGGETDADERVAIVARHGDGSRQELRRGELREQVRRVAAHLRALGIGRDDRVVAIAANNAEAIVAALATATLGATFSSASPEMGSAAILSRFEQLAPKLLFAKGGGEGLGEVTTGLPTLETVVVLNDPTPPAGVEVPVLRLDDLLASPPPEPLPGGWERFPFNHPLFILFTSGTTGPPKCIVHGAGGTLLEHLKEHRLHGDLRPEDTLFFQTSAAWMMWNWQLSALACGAKVVVYDGPIAEPGALWRIVAEEGVTVFGTSPPYLQLCQDSGFSPRAAEPPRALRSILSTGSVLRDWQYDWVVEEIGAVALQSISGGTDIIGCFVLGHPDLPVRRGMIQCRSLGLDVQALRTEATPSDSAVGELVCRNPFPSRPLGFLGDEDRSRFHDAYFAANEGVWTHGDLIEFDADGQARIHGRSDGVLNIQGVRIGPSEIYQALREVPEVAEAMAVEQRRREGARLVLLVVPREGAEIDGELSKRINRTIAEQTTPLHVPELVVAVEELPVTHSGKRSERAGRAAVEGEAATNRKALANPESLERIRTAVVSAEAALAQREDAALAGASNTTDKVRAIWESVLGIEGIADADDFFALGGSSLQAVRVFTWIRDHLGVDLPLSVLIEAPTLEALAAAVNDPGRHFEPLVLMRAGSGGQPLFLVHSIWGDVLGMRQLAVAMQADVPVYGLRAQGLQGEEPQRSVEEMGATYVEVIRTQQPQGPYRIAGHSFGGLLAFEIARLLAEEGEEVEWLGLIDAELSSDAHSPARRWGHRLALPYHYARAALRQPRAALDAVFGAVPKLLRRGFSRLHRDAALAESEATWMEGASEEHQRLASHFLRLAAAYRPRPYRGSMTYFLPTVRRFHLFADPLPVWRRVTAGRIEIERVPGPHVGMVSGDSALVIAQQIDRHLAAQGSPMPTNRP
ncbi:MAG TPA: acetoacetate--CoA ligase [Solirubrobacterales bacterium]|nr:acetoacetate--CoA ligase [Solirubrobacterales bacterium]